MGTFGCSSCKRIARKVASKHGQFHRSSYMHRNTDRQFNYSADGFNCHNSFFLTGLGRAKEIFKLKRLDHYLMCIDKMFYDLFITNMLYNYVGVSAFDTSSSSLSELSQDGRYFFFF